MTCIVALRENNTIWMGGDSAASSQWDTRIGIHSKVFVVNKMLIGYTASFRMGQLLQYRLADCLPEYDEESDVMTYMIKSFVPSVRVLLKEHGFASIDNNTEVGGDFIVGFKSRIFGVYSDYSIQEYADDFHAVGCGANYALGAMQALADTPSKERIERALEISAHFSNGVRGPFTILHQAS